MRRLQLTRGRLISLSAGVLAFHAACILLAHGHTAPVAPFLVLFPGLAGAVCLWRARLSAPRPRLLWTLLATGLLIWTFAGAMSIREEFFLKTPTGTGSASQVVYFMYGIPLLLAVALQTESSISSPLFWLDGIQVAITAILIYVQVFDVLPFQLKVTEPATVNAVVLTFNIENVVLAVAATLRLLATPLREDLRRFYRSLVTFLWLYAVASAAYNSITIALNGQSGLFDLLVDLPFLAICAMALVIPRRLPEFHRSSSAGSLALLLDNGSPAIFPAAVLALGIAAARHHFTTGMAAIALSLFAYGVRSTLLQVRYQQAQAEAREARDRMEILSLTDPLTGIPNRRQFDRVMQAEWNRLSRQPGPLSLLLIDIDHFKYLNDAFGHSEGDICLRQVAHVLQASLRRESDTLARYGGEEFAAVLPNTDSAGAEAVALRMTATLRNVRLRNRSPLGNIVTVSIGCSTCELPSGHSLESLFDASDRGLYRAKQNGRDRTEVEALPAV